MPYSPEQWEEFFPGAQQAVIDFSGRYETSLYCLAEDSKNEHYGSSLILTWPVEPTLAQSLSVLMVNRANLPVLELQSLFLRIDPKSSVYFLMTPPKSGFRQTIEVGSTVDISQTSESVTESSRAAIPLLDLSDLQGTFQKEAKMGYFTQNGWTVMSVPMTNRERMLFEGIGLIN
jgi:hypothetical protein